MSKDNPLPNIKFTGAIERVLKGLTRALDASGTAAVIFGPDEKLVWCTDAFLQINEDIKDYLIPGAGFRDLCKRVFDVRDFPDTDPDTWLKECYERFKNPIPQYVERHSNGKIYRSQDFRTPEDIYVGLREDVTEKSTAAVEKARLENRFEILAELTSDFFWEMDADLRFSSFYGKKAEQAHHGAIGSQRWETATEADLQDEVKWTEHRKQLQNHLPFRDFIFELATEPPKWARVSGEPVFDENNIFKGYIGATTVVTSQIHNELRLKQSELKYKKLVEGSVQGVIVHADNRPLFVNQTVANLLGYSREELLALASLDQLFSGGSLSLHKAYGNARMIGIDVPEEYETEWVRKDRKRITIRQMSQRIDWEGRPAIQATIVDISNQKKAEARVNEQDRLLRVLADGLPINIVYVDQKLKYRFVNNAYLSWYNDVAENILGRHVSDIMGPTAFEVVRARIEAALKGEQQNFETEIPFLHAGKKLVQTIYVPHRDNQGSVLGIYGLVIDITDKKQAEQRARDNEIRYSRMLAIAPDAIVATDETFKIKVFNKGAEDVFGFTVDEVIDRNIDLLLPQRFHDMHSRHIEKFLAGPDESRMMSDRSEIFGRRKDGTEFPAEASISKLRLAGETILTVMLHDITERKKVEADLIEAKEKAEYADRAKTEFLANMSHELRTPLNAILGFAEMMTQKTFGPLGDAHYEEYSDNIFASGDHLLSLINEILDISKIEAGRVDLMESDINVTEVVDDCLRIIEPRAADSQQKLVFNNDQSFPRIRGDKRRIKQILVNLLSNAVKFSDAGGEVTVSRNLCADGSFSLSVSDTGIGIAEEDIEKAMMTFGQVDSTLARKYEGTGLGIPLVKSLIELHDGEFTLESTEGVGTTCAIRFPKYRVLTGN
jgi:PAS domain S-box-containing protein